MTSRELYHGSGLEGYRTVATRSYEGKTILGMESTLPREHSLMLRPDEPLNCLASRWGPFLSSDPCCRAGCFPAVVCAIISF